MNLPDHLLPTELCWAANVLCLLLLGYSFRTAPWDRLRNTDLLNVFMGITAALALIWSIKAGIKPGLNFHLLGATLLTLMFGPQLAIISLSLVLLAVTLFDMAGWLAYGLNFMLMIALPALFSHVVFRWIDRKLPNHLFIYIFVSGFACAAVAIALCGVVTGFIMVQSEIYKQDYINQQYLPYFILMAWSEALLTGMAVTLMAAFRPEWLTSFSDQRYLKTKK